MARCFVPTCAEDRPTDFGAVKAGEMAGFGAELVFADRPLVADEMFGDVGAQLPVAPINIGSGAYPVTQEIDGESAELTLTLERTYSKPGTYFPTALVESHRDGDIDAASRRIPNLDAARIVVTDGGVST